MADVIAAVATGKSPSAIGILRLSGDGCADAVGTVFRCQSGMTPVPAPNRKLILGTLLASRGGRSTTH